MLNSQPSDTCVITYLYPGCLFVGDGDIGVSRRCAFIHVVQFGMGTGKFSDTLKLGGALDGAKCSYGSKLAGSYRSLILPSCLFLE